MDPDSRDRQFHDALVLGTLLAPEGGVAYLSAMRHRGWIPASGPSVEGTRPGTPDHGPIRIITGKRVANMHPVLLGWTFELVLTRASRVFGIDHASRGGLALRVTGRERTVIDMMDRTDLCGGMATVAAALPVAWPQLDRGRLIRGVERFGSGTVPKRLGYLVERLGLEPVGSQVTEQLRDLIAPGYSVLERGGPNAGAYVRRWMVRVNVSDTDLGSQ